MLNPGDVILLLFATLRTALGLPQQHDLALGLAGRDPATAKALARFEASLAELTRLFEAWHQTRAHHTCANQPARTRSTPPHAPVHPRAHPPAKIRAPRRHPPPISARRPDPTGPPGPRATGPQPRTPCGRCFVL